GAAPPWPAAKIEPSGAHRILSTRKPSGMVSRLGGVWPRDKRKKDWLPHAATYSVLPSFEISRPFAPAASLPGTFFQPLPVCHSHSSPLFSPAIIFVRALGSPPRARKFVPMKPPSGRATTEFRPIGSGATAHPIQVNAGGFERASTSKASIDSLLPW